MEYTEISNSDKRQMILNRIRSDENEHYGNLLTKLAADNLVAAASNEQKKSAYQDQSRLATERMAQLENQIQTYRETLKGIPEEESQPRQPEPLSSLESEAVE